MQLANMMYDFFGFGSLLQDATFPDLLSSMLKIGCGLWVTIFIIRSLIITMTLPERGF